MCFRGWLNSHGREEPPSFDLVVHLAANIESIDRRAAGGAEMFCDSQLDLTVMRYIERHPPKCYVHLSSCVVSYPASEDPYCAVKTFGEAMAVHVCKKAGIPLVLLRPFSGYGSDQASSYPFPALLGRALRKEDPLIVWGTGNQVRDFVHVDDIVAAILHGINGGFPYGVPVEVGTACGVNFFDLAGMMASAVGYIPKIQADSTKPSGATVRVMSSDTAWRHGWRAKVGLEEGIQRAVEELRGIPDGG